MGFKYLTDEESKKRRVNLGLVIRKKRRELKLTQADIAKQVGATKQLISYIENGERPITLEYAFQLSQLLKFESFEEFLKPYINYKNLI